MRSTLTGIHQSKVIRKKFNLTVDSFLKVRKMRASVERTSVANQAL